jgi:hypothetical protein
MPLFITAPCLQAHVAVHAFNDGWLPYGQDTAFDYLFAQLVEQLYSWPGDVADVGAGTVRA